MEGLLRIDQGPGPTRFNLPNRSLRYSKFLADWTTAGFRLLVWSDPWGWAGLREDCVVNGEVSDSWVYGLIRREWPPPSEPVPAS